MALLVAACVPPAARADGDPASDVLLQQDAYYPYAPKTSDRMRRALDRTLAEARAAGYPMKVALIEAPSDLGAYGSLFGSPQRYANGLYRTLQTIRHGTARTEELHLLVVSPGGFAGNGLGHRVDAAIGPLSVDTGAQSDGLAQAAMHAVARLATVNGHRVAVPTEARVALAPRSESTKRSGPSLVVYVLPALLVVAGAVLAGRAAARREARADRSN